MRPAIAALQALRALMKRRPDLLGLHFSDMYSSIKKRPLSTGLWTQDGSGICRVKTSVRKRTCGGCVPRRRPPFCATSLRKCFAGCPFEALFNGSRRALPCARSAISVLNGSELSIRLVCYSHDLPVAGAFQTAPPPLNLSRVLVSLRYSSLSNGQTPADAGVYHCSELLRLRTAVRLCRTQHRLLSKRCCHRHGSEFTLSIEGGAL
jgi:hypothetical protein